MSHVIDPPALTDVPWDIWQPHHAEIRQQARTWISQNVRPFVDEWEANVPPGFGRELFIEAAKARMFGWKFAEWVGGNGVDFLADAVLVEELARGGSGGVAAALGAHKDLGAYYLWRFGTDAQRERWVPGAMRGELITALGVTEPNAGTDVARIRTRAVQQPDGDWILNGSKTFITNGSWADVLVIAAQTSEEGGHHGMTLFVVEKDDPGFTSQRIDTLGWRTSHTGELSFTDVRLPADRVLGEDAMLNQGFICIMRNFQWERVCMALGATIGARRVMDEGLALLDGDVPPQWRMRVAEVDAEIRAVRSLTVHALRCYLSEQDAVREVSMAKNKASVLSVTVSDLMLELLGTAGSNDIAWIQRALRDARLNPIGGGTTEIMSEVVGKTYGL